MISRAAGTGLLFLALAAPASAAPVAEQVQSGQVTATLTYEKRGEFAYSDYHLQIQRGGQTLVEEDLDTGCDSEPCGILPANSAAGEDSITARDLDRDGEPEVLIDLFTGGAHCCLFTIAYGYQADTGTYKRFRHDWRDAGYVLRDIGRDGIVELDSRDANFAGAFGSYAGSYFPIQIFRFREGKFVDVTKGFKKRIRTDARRAFRLYKRYRGNENAEVGGFLAGWAADKYLLGERRSAIRTLKRAVRRGDIRVLPRSYVKRVKRLLRKLGYA